MAQRRKTSGNRRNTQKPIRPPAAKNPKVFWDAFTKELGRDPVCYLIEKIKTDSSENSIQYLFEIVAAEIELKYNCTSLGYLFYYLQAKTEIEKMKHTMYDKLVRDNIPEILERRGKICSTEVLSDERYLAELDKKLSEEVSKYQSSKSLEELADLLEIMGAVVKAKGSTWDELTRIRKERRSKYGAFEKKILLREVVEK